MEKGAKVIMEYKHNFHIVASLLGAGLSHLFAACGLEQLALAEILCFHAISNSSRHYIGYCLTNFICHQAITKQPPKTRSFAVRVFWAMPATLVLIEQYWHLLHQRPCLQKTAFRVL